jgi:hypothetical protein
MLYIILLLVGVASQASQVKYNPRTGVYEQVEDSQTNAARPHLFNGRASSKTKTSWILPSLSIYGGMSLKAVTSDKLTYTDLTQKTTTQTIPSTAITSGSAVFGAELLIPTSRHIKIGGGISHNTTQSLFDSTIAANNGQLFKLNLGTAVYGKMSYTVGRITGYALGGMQTSKMSFYDSIEKDDKSNPWTYLNPKAPATYDLLGKYSAKNAFFGVGAAYKLSPSFSVFIDATYLTISGLTGTAESTATATQINALKNAQYGVLQNRFGFSLDFIGLASDTI